MSSERSEGPIATERGWGWLAKLSGFAGVFLSVGIALAWLLVWVDAPVSTGVLTVWSVLPLVVAGLGTTWLMTSLLERRPLVSLGLRLGLGGLGDVGLGTVIGLTLIGAVIAVFAALGWVTWTPVDEPGSPLLAAVSLGGLLFLAAFVEELLFRGFPFQVLLRRFGPALAIGVTAVAFGGLHGGNPNTSPLALINITLAGFLLGLAYWKTGSLWFATGVHLGWNWAMALSELSVSGLEEFGLPGFDTVLSGPTLWTGGAFGPEGGLAVTIVSFLGMAWMWRLGPRDVNLSSLEGGAPSSVGGPGRGFKLQNDRDLEPTDE